MIDVLKPLIKKFAVYAKDNLNFKRPPSLFLKNDSRNGDCALGKTAHYDPQKNSITLYILNRHPKDIIRSFAHELVHHCQNERGDLAPEKMKTLNKNYAQENDHMRKMEEEAYLQGNMCFRDWEDGLDDKLQYKMKIAEQKFLKENKQMTVKINKQFLKGLITKLLEEKESKLEEGELAPALQKYQDEQAAKKDNSSSGDKEKESSDSKSKDSAGKTSSEAPMSVPADDEDDNKEESAEGAAKDKERQEESKIQTPEQENTLYEQRFTPKNSRLYEKLLKEWTK